MKRAIVSIIILFSIIGISNFCFAKYVLTPSIFTTINIDNSKPKITLIQNKLLNENKECNIKLVFNEDIIVLDDTWQLIESNVIEKTFYENCTYVLKVKDKCGNSNSFELNISGIEKDDVILKYSCFRVDKFEVDDTYFLNKLNKISIEFLIENYDTLDPQSLNHLGFNIYDQSYNKLNIHPQIEVNENKLILNLENIEDELNLSKIIVENSITMDTIANINCNIVIRNNLLVNITKSQDDLIIIESNNYLINSNLIDKTIYNEPFSTLYPNYFSDSFKFVISSNTNFEVEDIYGNIFEVVLDDL